MKPITEKTLKANGFIKKMNLWFKDGCSLTLVKGHTWVISKANCDSRDVKTIEDTDSYIANPPKSTSSKVAL